MNTKESGPQKAIELSPENKILKKRFQKLYGSIPKSKQGEFMHEIVVQDEKIRKEHKNYLNYEVFHILATSTPNRNLPASSYISSDFPGGCSVKKFIEDMETKYTKRSI